MPLYTVVTLDRSEPPTESCWSSPKAALSFADKIYLFRNVKAVEVWKGESGTAGPPGVAGSAYMHLRNPEALQNAPPGLLYMRTKPY
jgi:hypothetical protein